MTIFNKTYKIKIYRDDELGMGSLPGLQYDRIYNPYNIDTNDIDYFSVLSVDIDSEKNSKIAFIGILFSTGKDIAILKNDKLFVLFFSMIIEIDLHTLDIFTHDIAEYQCFSIYEFDSGYIIHGEMEIVKLNKNLEVEWSEMGADIFVNPDRDDVFRIENDMIHVIDWDGRKYVFDKDGNDGLNHFYKLRKSIDNNMQLSD